jgi:SAM-dependent methyltransferase
MTFSYSPFTLPDNRLPPLTTVMTEHFNDESSSLLFSKIISMLPHSGRPINLLSIGAHPSLSSLIKKMTNHTVVDTFHGEEAYLFQRSFGQSQGEKSFNPLIFDLERDAIPFPEGYFEGALLIDVLQHLVANPPFVLSEIHRVLKPCGFLILSTPNAARFENLIKNLRGENIFEHYGGKGMWGRSCREFTLGELEILLRANNFEIIKANVADINKQDFAEGRACIALQELINLLFPAKGRGEFREQIFLFCIANGSRKYCFPEGLFRTGKEPQVKGEIIAEGGLPRHIREHREWILDFVEMGFNDHIQLGKGWLDCEEYDGAWFRKISAEGDTFLRSDRDWRMLILDCKPELPDGKLPVPFIVGNRSRIDYRKKFVLNPDFSKEPLMRFLFLLPPSPGSLRKVEVYPDGNRRPSKASAQSNDSAGGMAVKSIRLLLCNQVIMGYNDDILLQDGWEILECWPPFARFLRKKASLILYPCGGENVITGDYFIPAESTAPQEFLVEVGPCRFAVACASRGEWQTFTHILPGKLHDEVVVSLALPEARLHSRKEKGPRKDIPHLGIGFSRIGLAFD